MTVEITPEDLSSHAENEWVSQPSESDDSIGVVFARLVDSGKDYAQAEVNRQRFKAGVFGSAARDVAILLGLAIILVFASIVSLLVGLIIALSPMLSPIGATAAVVGGALIVAILLALGAKSRVGKTKEALKS